MIKVYKSDQNNKIINQYIFKIAYYNLSYFDDT